MRVEFLSRFNRDINRIRSSRVRKYISKVITDVEQAKNLSSIRNVKKLAGHASAYRIRVGDYRIGIFVEKGTVQFARIVHRKDIYKVFP